MPILTPSNELDTKGNINKGIRPFIAEIGGELTRSHKS